MGTMTVNIGVFEKQEEVVEAIRLLREAGVDHDDIRVIVKNAENAPLIASNTDVPVEDLTGIQEAREHQPGPDGTFPIGAAAVPASTGIGTGNPEGLGGGFAVGAFHLLDDDRDHTERVLRDVGIPKHAADRCEEEVGAGRYLLLAETEEDTNASSLLRHAGASDVLH